MDAERRAAGGVVARQNQRKKGRLGILPDARRELKHEADAKRL